MFSALKDYFHNTKEDPAFLVALRKELNKFEKTPDLALLERYEWQLLFVPDEIKPPNHMYELIAGHANLEGTAFTNNLFEAWATQEKPRKFIPLIKKDGNRLQGQVWSVRPYRFPDLDAYKNNKVTFIRVRVSLVLPFRRQVWFKDLAKIIQHDKSIDFSNIILQTSNQVLSQPIYAKVKAWMYIGINSYWNNELDGGYKYRPIKPRLTKTLGKCIFFNDRT